MPSGSSRTGPRFIRLVGAVLADQNDEWAERRCSLGLEVLARCRLTTIPDTTTGKGTPTIYWRSAPNSNHSLRKKNRYTIPQGLTPSVLTVAVGPATDFVVTDEGVREKLFHEATDQQFVQALVGGWQLTSQQAVQTSRNWWSHPDRVQRFVEIVSQSDAI